MSPQRCKIYLALNNALEQKVLNIYSRFGLLPRNPFENKY